MGDLSWRCEAHDVVTTGDCPRCDDELIALTQETAPSCRTCGGSFSADEEVFTSDWKVIDVSGQRANLALETRYQHIACADTEAVAR